MRIRMKIRSIVYDATNQRMMELHQMTEYRTRMSPDDDYTPSVDIMMK